MSTKAKKGAAKKGAAKNGAAKKGAKLQAKIDKLRKDGVMLVKTNGVVCYSISGEPVKA